MARGSYGGESLSKSPPNKEQDRLSSGDGDSSSPPYPRVTGDEKLKEAVEMLTEGSKLITYGMLAIRNAIECLLEYEKLEHVERELIYLLIDLANTKHYFRIRDAIKEIEKVVGGGLSEEC